MLGMTVLKRYIGFSLRKYTNIEKKDQLLDRISVVCLSIVSFCLFKVLQDEDGDKIYALVGDDDATKKVKRLIAHERNVEILVLSKMWRVKEDLDVRILKKDKEYENMLLKHNKFHLLFCAYTGKTHSENENLQSSRLFTKIKRTI
ncbi:uncharacterized protein LOC143051143 [Mytilus galloprovincialis]|uniref:uncharacterized protein LOC143051143 n=1 Tax=Mytilus galloprovincialis TaxID=29158 RepID=UPI003F7BE04E